MSSQLPLGGLPPEYVRLERAARAFVRAVAEERRAVRGSVEAYQLASDAWDAAQEELCAAVEALA